MIYSKLMTWIIFSLLILSIDSLSQSSGGFGWAGEAPHSSLYFEGHVYKIPKDTSSVISTQASVDNEVGTIHTSVLDVQPSLSKNGFLGERNVFNWFTIDYHGYFIVNQDGLYKFRLVSDDGSILYIDEDEIINNDGIHPTKSGSGEKYLNKKVPHTISVRYFQAAGDAVLRLFWTPPGGNEKIFKPKWATQDYVENYRRAIRYCMLGCRIIKRDGSMTEAEEAYAKAKELGYDCSIYTKCT